MISENVSGCVLGIAFVGKPSFIFGAESEEMEAQSTQDIAIGMSLGLVSAICSAAQFSLVHYLKDDCHWLQVECTSAVLGTLVLCPVAAVCFALYDYSVNGHNFYLKFNQLTAGPKSEILNLCSICPWNFDCFQIVFWPWIVLSFGFFNVFFLVLSFETMKTN